MGHNSVFGSWLYRISLLWQISRISRELGFHALVCPADSSRGARQCWASDEEDCLWYRVSGSRLKCNYQRPSFRQIHVRSVVEERRPFVQEYTHTSGCLDVSRRSLGLPAYRLSGCVLLVVVTAFIIAEAVPVFGNLIALVGALLGVPLSLIVPTFAWFHVSRKESSFSSRSAKWRIELAWTIFVFCFSAFIMVAGSYSTISIINHQVKTGSTVTSFSCADNSGSV